MEWLTEVEELIFLFSEDISFQVIDPISVNISVSSFEFLLLKFHSVNVQIFLLVLFTDTLIVT